jgi:hypothetical protein
MHPFRRKCLVPNHAAMQVIKQSQNLNGYIQDHHPSTANDRAESQSDPRRSKPRWRKAVVRMYGRRASREFDCFGFSGCNYTGIYILKQILCMFLGRPFRELLYKTDHRLSAFERACHRTVACKLDRHLLSLTSCLVRRAGFARTISKVVVTQSVVRPKIVG